MINLMNNQITTTNEVSNSFGVHVIENPIIENNIQKGKEVEYSGKLNDGSNFRKKVIDYGDTTEFGSIKVHKEVFSSTNTIGSIPQNMNFFSNMFGFNVFQNSENKKSTCKVEEVIDDK